MGKLSRIAAVGILCLFVWADRASAAPVCDWVGAGTTANWSEAANWLCGPNGSGAGGTARIPATGDIVRFQNGMPQPANVDDIPSLTPLIVRIKGVGAANVAWNITPANNATIVLNQELSADSPADGVGHGPSFLVPIQLNEVATVISAGTLGTGTAPLAVGNIDLNGDTLTFNAVAPITVTGTISGDGLAGHALEKDGTSTVTLQQDNSYVGDALVSSGGLVVNTSHGLSPNTVAEVLLGATLTLTDGVAVDQSVPIALTGGTIAVPAGASATIAGAIQLVAPSTLQPAGILTVSGRIGATPSRLTMLGGTLILSNSNNAILGLTVSSGTLRVGASGALPPSTQLTLNTDPRTNSTLDLNGFDTTIASLAGVEGGHILLGAQTLTLGVPANTESEYNGSIAGTGNVKFVGPGTFRLAGAQPNTYTGTTTVTNGTINLAKTIANATITGPLVINSGSVNWQGDDQIADQVSVTVNNTGALISDHNAVKETIGSLAGSGLVQLEDGTLTVGTANTDAVYTGRLTGARIAAGQPPEAYFRLVKVGTGSLTLSGNNLPGDQIVVDGGTLLINGLSNGSGVLVRGGIFGGSGTLLNGANTLTSTIAVTGGALAPGAAVGSAGTLQGDTARIDAAGSLLIHLVSAAPGSYPQLALTHNLQIAAGAQLNATLAFTPPRGTTFILVSPAPGQTVSGTFANLPEGATLTLGASQHFSITYQGGPNHNSVVLTALDGPPPPPSQLTYYLSEGATGDFFDEDILIANPNTTDAPVTITFSTETGQQIVDTRTVPAQSRMTVHVDKIAGLEKVSGVSAQVTSTNGLPLVVERSMFWDASYYAGSTGSSVDTPAPDWFFAEGSQGFFYTFVLINNPNATPTDVTFSFFLEGGQTAQKTITVGATTRLTFYAGDDPQLVNQSFGIAVHATQPIMAERSMYFGTRPDGRVWCGGTESAGVTATSTHWFLAEGATGGFFNTYVLLSNPNLTTASVTVKYLLPDGTTITSPKTLPPHTRLTTNIGADEHDVRLKNTAVSTVVTSDQPIIAERSMYWPGAIAPFGEGHNSFGVVDAGLKWGLAEGRTGTPLNYHTYILLANPQTTAANVTVTYLRETGAPITKTYTVAATSRFNIDSATLTELHDEYFGALIEVTNNVPIIVERSLYWDSNGFSFSGGTNATGIALP